MLKLSQNALGMLIAKYRAVLKNMRLKAPALLAAGCLLAFAPAPAAAKYIEYKGDPNLLKPVPDWFVQGWRFPPENYPSFFPSATSGNTVVVDYIPNIDNSNVPYYVFGGLSENNHVTGNNVTIKNGKVLPRAVGIIYPDPAAVYGGYSYNGYATNNSVTVSGDAEVNANVIGGEGKTAANNNSVTISGDAEVNANVIIGGAGFNVTNNSVTISDNAKVVNFVCSIYGGNGSTAINNSVTISGNAEVSGFVTGGNGYSSSGNAISNSVTISGNATVSHDVTGGFSYGNAISNSVTVSDNATVSRDVYGGDGCVATNNSVTISGGMVSGNVYGGNGYGYVFDDEYEYEYGYYYGDANNNSVTISGGMVSGNVIGGIGYNVANNNSVTVSGGTVGGIIGGSTAGNLPGWIGGNATYNSVTVSGDATAGEFIYGGLSFNGDATHNSVTISDSPNLANSDLYGGDRNGGSGDVFTGNTLNVYSYKGESVKSINNFQNYDFFLPASMDYTKPLLEVSKWANPAGSGDITVRGVGIEGGGTPLAVGREWPTP